MAEPQLTALRAGDAIASRYLEDRADIQRAFRVFQDQRVRVSLWFDGDAETFTVRVLDVHDDVVLLDDIKPRSGLSRMYQAETFSLTGRNEGLFVYAESLRATVSESKRGLPYYSVVLPARVLYQQRRRSTRFRLPLRLTSRGARVRLERNGTTLEGSILDISVGGCRASFVTPVGADLAVSAGTGPCQIQIANLLSVTAAAAIRHVSIDAASGTVMCGIEFVRIDEEERRRLASFIQTIAHLAAPR